MKLSDSIQQSEEQIAAGLIDAQRKADALFAAVNEKNLIRPGQTEMQINEAVYALAQQMYGITRYWHKRIVRAGRNTLEPYDENPRDLTVQEDDIVFLDLGPVFEEWEADFGRTYVVGNDPLKQKLCRDIKEAFAKGKRYFEEHPEMHLATVIPFGNLWASCYFAMTGFHALHVLGGLVVFAIMLIMAAIGRFGVQHTNMLELVGLYWHFVDIVWIFLFPLLYLV